MTSEDY